MLIIGVDTGGTFTDFIAHDGHTLSVHKRLSTPDDPSRAVLEGIAHIAQGRPVQVIHGSTVATNALLERKGAFTALITNAGFEDVIEIGRQHRHRLYDLRYRRRPHLVPRELRFGIPGRITSQGQEMEPLDRDAVRAALQAIKKAGCQSVAVCLLFSFLHPEHEQAVGALAADLGLPVSLSHTIVAEFREFERTSTTVVNAYVAPKMAHYLGRIQQALGTASLRIMQSNGGSISAATAMAEPVRTILSGPAGGAVGALAVAQNAGFSRIITFDMGGTSTDVALLDGALPITTEASIEGYPVKVPLIDIHTVGAGGGSLAQLDAGGALRVGPESAGADPGPICYGKGTILTVTDANLFLGRLVPEHFLGGNMPLHTEAVAKAMEALARQAGLSAPALAEGILEVANATMERAIRVISVERGYDPREFTLVAFGGAGGLHACQLARQLSIPRVLIPQNPGILSAVGMIRADVVKDYSITVMAQAHTTPRAELEERFNLLLAQGKADLAAEGIPPEDMRFEPLADLRYAGQSFEVTIPWGDDPVVTFAAAHERMYGYRHTNKPVEIVTLRLRARGSVRAFPFSPIAAGSTTPPPPALLGNRPVFFDSIPRPTPIYARHQLLAGNHIPGPAILVEYTATVVIPPGALAVVDDWGNLVIAVEAQ